MLRIGALSLILLTAFAFLARPAQAQLFTGAATQYSITVQKAELCSDSACTTGVTVGNGTASLDIASTSAGADIASYADTSGLTPGSRFSYVRITMSRNLSIKGSVAVTGLGTCATNAAGSAANTTTAGGGALAGVPSAQTLVVPDAGAFAGQPTAATYSNAGITLANASTMTVVLALPSPITVGNDAPSIRIAFNTQGALAAYNNGGACAMLPQAPSVTVTAN